MVSIAHFQDNFYFLRGMAHGKQKKDDRIGWLIRHNPSGFMQILLRPEIEFLYDILSEETLDEDGRFRYLKMFKKYVKEKQIKNKKTKNKKKNNNSESVCYIFLIQMAKSLKAYLPYIGISIYLTLPL